MLRQEKNLAGLRLDSQAGPAYRQIKAWIREAISRGHFTPGEVFPSEVELADQAGVTRATVRNATNELVAEGLLIREQGKRPRVAPRKRVAQFLELAGISQYVTEDQGEYECRVRTARFVSPPSHVAKALGVRTNTKVFLLERLRSADGAVFGYERAWINKRLCPGIEKHDFAVESLYTVLRNTYQLLPSHAEGTVEVGIASGPLAELLELKEGTPLLSIDRTVFTSEGAPLQVNHEVYRGDTYSFAYQAGRISPSAEAPAPRTYPISPSR